LFLSFVSEISLAVNDSTYPYLFKSKSKKKK